MRTILEPKLTSQDHQQAQTPFDTTTGVWHLHHVGQSHHVQDIDPQ